MKVVRLGCLGEGENGRGGDPGIENEIVGVKRWSCRSDGPHRSHPQHLVVVQQVPRVGRRQDHSQGLWAVGSGLESLENGTGDDGVVVREDILVALAHLLHRTSWAASEPGRTY